MRKREYLSPSAIKTYYDSPEDYYMRYLSDIKKDPEPQTQPMSIGSAFDAYAKSNLIEKLFGKINPLFEFQTLFEAQVEPHNRDWAIIHGKYAFEQYTLSGALNDLYVDLSQAEGEPQFEFEIRGSVTGNNLTDGLLDPVLLGKPDVYYINKEKFPVILDWKVNGWCSKSPKSPEPGYVRLRHCDGTQPKNISHKDAYLVMYQGVRINAAKKLEEVNEDWAAQLAIYGWLMGQSVGSEFITGIDQLCCAPTGGFPTVRVAEHRCLVSKSFQEETYLKARKLWNIVNSDHFFRDMTYEDSLNRCKILDGHSNGPVDPLFDSLTNTKRFW